MDLATIFVISYYSSNYMYHVKGLRGWRVVIRSTISTLLAVGFIGVAHSGVDYYCKNNDLSNPNFIEGIACNSQIEKEQDHINHLREREKDYLNHQAILEQKNTIIAQNDTIIGQQNNIIDLLSKEPIHNVLDDIILPESMILPNNTAGTYYGSSTHYNSRAYTAIGAPPIVENDWSFWDLFSWNDHSDSFDIVTWHIPI